MPNFNFKSQFPIADVINAIQKKPLLEAQIQQMQQDQKNARLKTLLDALSTGAQVARSISQNKTDALGQQAAQSQMAGQKDLQSILSEPAQQAAVASPIQHFGPSMTPGPVSVPQEPQPTNMSTPTFSATPQGQTQAARAQAALLQSNPDAYTKNAVEAQFETGSNNRQMRFQQADYLDAEGHTRIGTFDPKSGGVIQRHTDPLKGYALGFGTDPLTGLPYTQNKSTGNVNSVTLPTSAASTGVPVSSYTDLPPNQRKIIDDTAKAVEGDSIITGLRETKNNLNRLSGLVNSNDPAALGAIQSQMARAIAGEKGVLTDADVARNTGDRALASRFKRFISVHATGELTQSDRKDFNALLQLIDQKSQQNLDKAMKGYINRTKVRMPNVDENFIKHAISITDSGSALPDATGGGGLVDPAALDAELKRRNL